MVKHINDGNCQKCEEIFNKYPDFNLQLKAWFKGIQSKYPEAHISCAGRGFDEQEVDYTRHSSNAHYGQSAHNYNCAIDIFRLLNGAYNLDKLWFQEVVGINLPDCFKWYGDPHGYYELPHVEIYKWKEMRDRKQVRLVE